MSALSNTAPEMVMNAGRRVIADDPHANPYEGAMQFRLTYEGRLLSAGNNNPRPEHKHEIRMKLAPQLKRLWEVNAALSGIKDLRFPDVTWALSGQAITQPGWERHSTYTTLVSGNFQMHNRHWMPLVCPDMGLTCAVDILFLRQGSRGGVLNVGDIDGRLKTIFDALAIPRSGSGLPTQIEEQPIYVLLSDDSLISNASVETDELLEPTSSTVGQHDSRVIITVNIKPIRANFLTLAFAGL